MSGPTSAWTCPICGQRYEVPSLARDCEAKCREIVWVESGKEHGVMSTGMYNYGSGGRTWARWRERNRTGRDAYYDRMEAADQCLATCSASYYGPMLGRLNEGWPEAARRTDEPVALWETVTHTWADFKAAIERATHG